MTKDIDRIKQCRKPEGKLGKDVAKQMNVSHYNLWKWALSLFEINNGDLILDIGCGGGGTLKLMSEKAKSIKIYGIDYSEDMVKYASVFNKNEIDEGKMIISQGDANNLSFPDNMFDICTSFESSYFWENIIQTIAHIKTKIKPGGIFVLVNEDYISNKITERQAYIEKTLNIKYLKLKDYSEIFKKSGFSDFTVNENRENGWITVIAHNN